MLYPFQISVTTPRPTESLSERKVRMKLLVYSTIDENGNEPYEGLWQEVPYDCLKGLVPIKDQPVPGLKSVPGDADPRKSEVYTRKPDGSQLTGTDATADSIRKIIFKIFEKFQFVFFHVIENVLRFLCFRIFRM